MISESIVVISNWCNLSCPHCLQDAGIIKRDEVPVEDVIDFLDTLPDLTDLKITGGEPLGPPVYDKTYKLSHYAISRGLSLTINTNGTFEIPTFDLPVDRVTFQVSLDGLKLTHDDIRGTGSFDKSLKFIKTQISRGYRVIVMSVIMGQYTLQSLEEFIDFVTITLRVKLGLQFIGSMGRGSSLQYLESILCEDKAIRLVSESIKNANIAECSLREKKKFCDYLHSGVRVSIDEFGGITPCPMLSKYKFGTIYNYDKEKVRQEMHDNILNCTCAYPNGYNPK